MRGKELVPPFVLSDDALGAGCYSLVIELRRAKNLRVGRLGVALFPQGIYVYTGSARNGLAARLRRHCKRNKKLHWHIDYLLAAREARIEKIILYPPAPGQECRRNREIASQAGAAVVLKRFGASDCTSSCASHLIHFAHSGAAPVRV